MTRPNRPLTAGAARPRLQYFLY
uniref:Uncharacterized protein n=1 Tax=Anguilla anguilla TaxID=7936 RepID=A0A0E9SIF5_ANGAN